MAHLYPPPLFGTAPATSQASVEGAAASKRAKATKRKRQPKCASQAWRLGTDKACASLRHMRMCHSPSCLTPWLLACLPLPDAASPGGTAAALLAAGTESMAAESSMHRAPNPAQGSGQE